MSYQLKNGKWIVGNLFDSLESESFSTFIKLEKKKRIKEQEKLKREQHLALLKSEITEEELVKPERNLKQFNYQFKTRSYV